MLPVSKKNKKKHKIVSSNVTITDEKKEKKEKKKKEKKEKKKEKKGKE